MKKILLSIAVILVTIFYTNAQSFSLSWGGEVIGDTVIITPDAETINDLLFEAIVHNNSDNGANVKVVREQVSLVDGSSNYFCWGACYPPFVDSSGMTMFIPAGGQSGDIDFSAHYEINETVGLSIIKFHYYNVDNPDDKIVVVVKFDTRPDGINEAILAKIKVSDIYPNPAVNYVDLNYDLPREVETATVKIVNILGSVVKEQQIDTGNGKLRMDISDMNDGIYFYSIFVNGEAYKTKKLIVK